MASAHPQATTKLGTGLSGVSLVKIGAGVGGKYGMATCARRRLWFYFYCAPMLRVQDDGMAGEPQRQRVEIITFDVRGGRGAATDPFKKPVFATPTTMGKLSFWKPLCSSASCLCKSKDKAPRDVVAGRNQSRARKPAALPEADEKSEVPAPIMTTLLLTAVAIVKRLGLSKVVSVGLKSAFPNITRPTDAQSTFIPAIVQGKDLILKGHPGSGKSFGLILALLSKYWTPLPQRRRSSPASLLLVPHRDLAYQYMHWIERIAATPDGLRYSTPVAQVIVRGSDEPSVHISRLRENPSNILIGTPQAILDVFQEDEHAINITNFRTIVIDEVDSIIDFIPADAYKARKQQLAAKMRRHPSAGKLLLDRIYTHRVGPVKSAIANGSPQLVACSATLQKGLRQQFYQNGWFRKGSGAIVKVWSEASAGKSRATETDGACAVPGEAVQHYALVFSEDGSVKDVHGVIEPKRQSQSDEEDAHGGRMMETWTDSELGVGELPEISSEFGERYSMTPSPFNPIVMEGVASIFATEVPKMALLVLPACAPVQRAIYDLRMLGVNAFGLDLLLSTTTDRRGAGAGGGGEAHGIKEEDNPRLLISTTATTRGLDLPDLSHVFVWGVGDVKVNTNTYVHLAGRVGRFRGGGKVISLLFQGE
ncbi:P-loop containing nucleoside triphosphate hydrolase protein [Multifurca ochricompacta]|uniref:RNA helicase n=1 Tax=Multifurca ochricompacta TaxID=376703 RepID=A0AAD4ME54_9AGAM|nr:P-loop containing nucleoside triphosphate hydrolase protein [Multifurca ochricompacta]